MLTRIDQPLVASGVGHSMESLQPVKSRDFGRVEHTAEGKHKYNAI